MNKQTKRFAMIAALASACCMPMANADLVSTLVKKGYITEAEAKEIGSSSKSTSFTAKGKHTKKIRFRGRMQFQFDNLKAENDEGGTNTTGTTNNFYFRRLYLGAKGYLMKDWEGDIVLDFATQAVKFETATINYTGFDDHVISFGHKKVPFGYEETISGSAIKPAERSAMTRVFSDDYDFGARHSGIHAKGKILDTGLSYAAALVNTAQSDHYSSADADGDGDVDPEGLNSYGMYGRLQYKLKPTDGTKLMFGGDYGYQTESPVLTKGGQAITAGGKGAEATAYTYYGKFNMSDFELMAAYTKGKWYNAGGTLNAPSDVEIDGFMIQGSYKFHNFEPVIRYSKVEADNSTNGNFIDYDELIRRSPENVNDNSGDELESWYFGFVYYLMGKDLQFQGGYEYAEGKRIQAAQSETEISGFRGRIQLLF